MIVLGIGFTLLLLVVTGLAAAYRPGGYAIACVVCVVCGGLCFPLSLFAAVNSALVLLVALACGLAGAKPSTFWKSALGASAVAYLIVFVLTLRYDKPEYPELRERYPYQSVADRLSYEQRKANKVHAPGRPATIASLSGSARLQELETQLSKGEQEASRRVRDLRQLHELHDSVVRRFINSPGFGVMRGIGPSEWTLRLPEVEPVPLLPDDDYFKKLGQGPQPASNPPTAAPAGPSAEELRGERLWRMHQDGLLDFANPVSFGFIKDRDHVAGFQPHQFSRMPSDPKVGSSVWRVLSVELVSLLKHESPAVYLSKNLPRMEELRNARTRPLDDFEQTQLAALRKGEDLRVSASADHMRVLGSLRAAKQCLSCHDAERGDLLGAFSYKLRREH